jgi:hypothetical protein
MSASAAMNFIQDVKDRLANRVQLTTDGHRPYPNAVEAVSSKVTVTSNRS